MNDQENLQTDRSSDSEKPIIITVISILGAAYNLMATIVLLFVPAVSRAAILVHGLHFIIVATILNFCMIVAFIGIWKLRYWGLILYCFSFIASVAYELYIGVEYYWSYIPAFIIVIICFLYIKRFH